MMNRHDKDNRRFSQLMQMHSKINCYILWLHNTQCVVIMRQHGKDRDECEQYQERLLFEW
jgi:hypothetical protein